MTDKPKAIGIYSCGHAVGLSGYDEKHKFPKCPLCGQGDFEEMHKVIV